MLALFSLPNLLVCHNYFFIFFMSLFFISFKHLTLFFAKKKKIQPYNETLAQKLVYSKI